MLPRDVKCPHCGAEIDHGCHSSKTRWYPAKTHKKRWLAVGVAAPTYDQRHADYEDGCKRDLKISERVFRELLEREKASRGKVLQ